MSKKEADLFKRVSVFMKQHPAEDTLERKTRMCMELMTGTASLYQAFRNTAKAA